MRKYQAFCLHCCDLWTVLKEMEEEPLPKYPPRGVTKARNVRYNKENDF